MPVWLFGDLEYLHDIEWTWQLRSVTDRAKSKLYPAEMRDVREGRSVFITPHNCTSHRQRASLWIGSTKRILSQTDWCQLWQICWGAVSCSYLLFEWSQRLRKRHLRVQSTADLEGLLEWVGKSITLDNKWRIIEVRWPCSRLSNRDCWERSKIFQFKCSRVVCKAKLTDFDRLQMLTVQDVKRSRWISFLVQNNFRKRVLSNLYRFQQIQSIDSEHLAIHTVFISNNNRFQ